MGFLNGTTMYSIALMGDESAGTSCLVSAGLDSTDINPYVIITQLSY
jgi:hypothetical protein